MRILVVDDNGDDRRLLRLIVERHGHEALEAEDGLEGLRTAKLRRPDLIISDALMPLLDGFQFLKKVKDDEELRATPFIFYSAIYKAEKDQDLARALGADAYILKPKEPAEFWREVEAILHRPRPESGAAAELVEADEEYLRRYSQVVASKLEEKVRELEETLALRLKAEKEVLFLASIAKHVPEAVCAIDPQANVMFWNDGAESMLGYPASEILGKPITSIIPENLVRQELEHCFGILEREGFLKDHLSVRLAKDGRAIPVEITAFALRDEARRITCFTSIMRDITERKRAEEELVQSRKLEGVGQLAGGIAHDFNNILGAIVLSADLLRMKLTPDSPLKDLVDQVLAAGERGATLTHQLLAFSRKQTLDMKETDLNAVVESLKKLLPRVIRENIRIEFALASGPVPVLADGGQIDQVLINLATNARDAMPEGGVLTIATGREELDEAFLHRHGCGEVGRYGTITVSDTGIGMDEATQKRIFEPFFTTKGEGKGTGLGLAVVYGIVRQHKGFIRLASAPGKGAAFIVYLPLLAASVFFPGAAGKKESPAGGTETILLAEDDPVIRMGAESILQLLGYTVITAEDGKAALQRFQEHRDEVDLIVSDLVMPNMSGLELYDEIRKTAPRVKVLFTTGYVSDEYNRDEIARRGLPLLMKPYASQGLLVKVREVLGAAAE